MCWVTLYVAFDQLMWRSTGIHFAGGDAEALVRRIIFSFIVPWL